MYLLLALILSASCSTALLITWYLLPKWNTLHNLIGVHQIIDGTIHMFLTDGPFTGVIYSTDVKLFTKVLVFLRRWIFINMLCWSLCASVFAFVKLRIVCLQSVSNERTKAFLFSYGITTLILTYTQGIFPNLLGEYFCRDVCELYSDVLGMHIMYLLVTANFILFVSVSRSVMKSGNPSARVKYKRVLSLIGVATLCDTITVVYILCVVPSSIFITEHLEVPRIVYMFRLIPPSLVLLFNKRSRELWVEYFRRLKSRRLN